MRSFVFLLSCKPWPQLPGWPRLPFSYSLTWSKFVPGLPFAWLGWCPAIGGGTSSSCAASPRSHLLPAPPHPHRSAQALTSSHFISPALLDPFGFQNHVANICTVPDSKAGWAVLSVCPQAPQPPLPAQPRPRR